MLVARRIILTRPSLQRAVTVSAATTRCYGDHLAISAHVVNSGGSRAADSQFESDGCRNGLGNASFQTRGAFEKHSSFSTSPNRLFSTTTSKAAVGQDFSTEEHARAVEEWLTQVASMVAAQPEVDVSSVEGRTINIMLRHSASGGLFVMEEATDAYRYVSMDVSSVVPRSANPKERSALAVLVCNFGPPVDVDTHAVLSMTLEPDSLANYLDDAENVLKNDEAAVKKLSLVAKYFATIKRSNV